MLFNSIPLYVSLALLSGHPFCHVWAGWIDPDTEEDFRTTEAITSGDDRKYKLVFSDEFNQEGRTFEDGNDPRWTAIEKNDYTNAALHYYKAENVRTENGILNITTVFQDNSFVAIDEDTDNKFIKTKHIQSGMLQGWNKFCFTGGILEISAKLPGKGEIGGLWPALWLLGNLARATYVGSSDFVWPWSYNQCEDSTRYSQQINACAEINHYGLKPHSGRGAPEIDLLEAMGGPPGKLPNTHVQRPYFSSSLQISPGVTEKRPSLGEKPIEGFWYEGLEYGNITNADLNPFFYGVTLEHKPAAYTYQSDALSANMHINPSHFEEQHIYRLEWEPSSSDGTGGYIRWYCDGELIYGIKSDVLKLTGSHIPDEPMYILLNTAVSSNWGFPKPCPSWCDCECFECGNPKCECGLPDGFCDNIPASFEIDYVRVYQAENEAKHELGCSTPRKPTKVFIEGHKERYMNDDDKIPLQPILKGGAECSTNDDCGGIRRGTCMNEKSCVCNEGFTGPKCLVDDASYDNVEPEEKFAVKRARFPLSLSIMLITMIFGLGTALVVNVIKEKKQAEVFRKKLGNDSLFSNAGTYVGEYTNYQSVSAKQSKQSSSNQWDEKVVSYCMIDNRLIDDK